MSRKRKFLIMLSLMLTAGLFFGAQKARAITQVQFGAAGDIPVHGDYDADGKEDIAVFRAAASTWFIRLSSTFGPLNVGWGGGGDIPVPGDYFGDSKTEVAVWRPSDGYWHINYGAGRSYQWGTSTDIPVPGDYDGDGKTDLAVFRPFEGNWYIKPIATIDTTGAGYTVTFGGNLDIPAPGDYDGDGRIEPGVYRPSDGLWYTITSGFHQLGTPGGNYIPSPGYYDGDGRTDLALFHPSSGTWNILYSSRGYASGVNYTFGLSGDVPMSGDFVDYNNTEPVFWRPSTGVWEIGPPPPNCTGGSPDVTWTISNTGNVLATATGVTNADDVYFPTWSAVSGQDDIVWYHLDFGAVQLNSTTWQATIPLANHPGLGLINVDIYAKSYSTAMQFCAQAFFSRVDNGTIQVDSNTSTTWTITCTLTGPVCPNIPAGASSTTATYLAKPFSSWTITPATKPGFSWQVTGCAINTPCTKTFPP